MLANYLIGLREGLEAALIVLILVAYLVKTRRTELVRQVWLGVAVAIGLSLAVGAGLTFGTNGLDEKAEETVTGVLSLLAVALVTVMIFWMASNARTLSGQLKGRVEEGIRNGVSLAIVAFLAVAREGLETALFLWAATRAAAGSGGAAAPLVGALLGLLTAVGLAYLMYRGALRIDLGRFFAWSAAALVLVAAGVLAYGVHELQEAGIIPGDDAKAFDLRGVIDPRGLLATLVRGTLNLTPAMSWAQVIAWLAYVVGVGVPLVRRFRRTHDAAAVAASGPAHADTASAEAAPQPAPPRS